MLFDKDKTEEALEKIDQIIKVIHSNPSRVNSNVTAEVNKCKAACLLKQAKLESEKAIKDSENVIHLCFFPNNNLGPNANETIEKFNRAIWRDHRGQQSQVENRRWGVLLYSGPSGCR